MFCVLSLLQAKQALLDVVTIPIYGGPTAFKNFFFDKLAPLGFNLAPSDVECLTRCTSPHCYCIHHRSSAVGALCSLRDVMWLFRKAELVSPVVAIRQPSVFIQWWFKGQVPAVELNQCTLASTPTFGLEVPRAHTPITSLLITQVRQTLHVMTSQQPGELKVLILH